MNSVHSYIRPSPNPFISVPDFLLFAIYAKLRRRRRKTNQPPSSQQQYSAEKALGSRRRTDSADLTDLSLTLSLSHARIRLQSETLKELSLLLSKELKFLTSAYATPNRTTTSLRTTASAACFHPFSFLLLFFLATTSSSKALY